MEPAQDDGRASTVLCNPGQREGTRNTHTFQHIYPFEHFYYEGFYFQTVHCTWIIVMTRHSF